MERRSALYGKIVIGNAKGLLTMPAISKITAKGLTTVPQEVRKALKSKPGDLIAWEIEPNGRVAVRGAQALDIEYLEMVHGTLCEWTTADDEKAYGRL
jgi:bifunctional DNA-binding transcriptional regulator/antitoxin component of YhaV-PrlF toxin-antitoxin module